MTSKLTRERIELIANFHRAMTLPPSHAEIEELARMALAAMDSEAKEPISFDEWSRKCALQITLCYPDFREKAQYIWDSARETQHVAPVAMPECFSNAVSALESLYRNGQKQCWHERYTTDMAYASGVLNACRAAMLQDDNCRENANSSTNNCREIPEMSTNAPVIPDGLPDGVNIYHGPKEKTILVLKQDAAVNQDCWCRTCRPVTLNDMRFVVCPECGNKRCPRANDHRNACTGSNEPCQEGSAYPAAPQEVKGD